MDGIESAMRDGQDGDDGRRCGTCAHWRVNPPMCDRDVELYLIECPPPETVDDCVDMAARSMHPEGHVCGRWEEWG